MNGLVMIGNEIYVKGGGELIDGRGSENKRGREPKEKTRG